MVFIDAILMMNYLITTDMNIFDITISVDLLPHLFVFIVSLPSINNITSWGVLPSKSKPEMIDRL